MPEQLPTTYTNFVVSEQAPDQRLYRLLDYRDFIQTHAPALYVQYAPAITSVYSRIKDRPHEQLTNSLELLDLLTALYQELCDIAPAGCEFTATPAGNVWLFQSLDFNLGDR